MTEHRIARAVITAAVYAVTLTTWSNLILWVIAAMLVVIFLALAFIWRNFNNSIDELKGRVGTIERTMKGGR